MRLIDADKLKEELEVNGLGYQYYMLDNAPTVKAIPIEWFKNLIKTVEDSKNYEESEILKWALDKWKNQEEENDQTN